MITDLRLGDEDGFDLISHTRKQSPRHVGVGGDRLRDPETAVASGSRGAFDLLTKPLIDEELSLAIRTSGFAARDHS